MATVSERLQAFERTNGDNKEAGSHPHSPKTTTRSSRPRTTSPKPKPKGNGSGNGKLAGTYGSRRRTRSKDNRIDLSDDEIDMDPERTRTQQQQQQQEGHELQLEVTEPPLLTSQSSADARFASSSITPKHERPVPSELPKDMVDLDLVAKSISTTKQPHHDALHLTKDEVKRKAIQEVKEELAGKNNEENNTTNEDAAAKTHHSKWAVLHRIWKDPLAEEKKRQEELMLQHLKETDSTFSEESYQIDKHTQDIFISTKKEEAETVRMEKERQHAKMRIPLWEKIVETTIAVFVSSVEAEKRHQEHVVMSHLRAMDSSVDEDGVRRQKEAQELFVTMKRRELERQRALEMEEVEKQRREAMLAENMRLPEGLQGDNSSLMMQNSIILQGAKIQEALRSSLYHATNFSLEEQGEEGEGEAAAEAPRQVPLHIQKQLQQALLLQQASENPDIEIDEEALRHSREIQESLLFYAQKNKHTSWLDSFMPKRSSVPEEVSFDEEGSVGSRVSWLSGGFGGGGSVNRPSWRSSFSTTQGKAAAASSPPRGKIAATSDSQNNSSNEAKMNKKKDFGKNGLRNSWHLRGSNHNHKVGKDWAEANLHLAGHAEESENSDL
eukprot:CAMPEP_0113644964 /NCGR_PEP_ID=MMETSP0017_2-20120614/23677_1 /TAXON_ID=2856 /ORGANISM="Cylindrotheca closterium" /LENGTH=610 /DNA_ID=CAMNT_0000556627 /DNA_START=58 /DNA_END=1890 /DNA_ORIENTATION=- /assembly_acc=CAM_ASM_000147